MVEATAAQTKSMMGSVLLQIKLNAYQPRIILKLVLTNISLLTLICLLVSIQGKVFGISNAPKAKVWDFLMPF